MTASWVKIAGWLAVLALLAAYSCSERRAGRAEERAREAEAVRDSALRVSDSTARLARTAILAADSLRVRARVEAARDRASQVKTDSILRASSDERTQAIHVLGDSLATVFDLRREVGALVERSRADSVAFAVERDEHRTYVERLLGVIAADSVALSRQTQSYAALEAQYQAEKRLSTIYRSQRGGGWRGQAIAAGITYGACRLLVRCN